MVCLPLMLTCAPLAWGQLPTGWADADIGSPGLAGSASYSAGTWTVTGGGGDIWNTADQFHYAYESTNNNAVILARVETQTQPDAWSKSGVMFRDSADPSAMFAMVVVTPGNGVNFQWRNSTGGQCDYAQAGASVPLWVKLVRNGSDFAGFYSFDGSTWVQIGGDQIIPMNSTALAGLCVTAHNNAALCTSAFTSVIVSNAPSAPPPPPRPFGAYRELWTGLSSAPGNTLAALTNTTYNPNWPNNPNSTYTKVFTNFETEINFMDYYGQRVRTFVVPPANGNYLFWIASDDSSQLFISTDETPAHRALVAWVSSWTSSREWTKEANQQSAPIALEGGRRYYIEALMQEGGGGDNLAVRWQLPNGTLEEPLSASSPAGTVLIPCNGVDAQPGIYQQTGNTTNVEGTNARFSVLVTNGAAVNYQWRVNGANIAGAVKPFCIVSNLSIAANNGQIYTCLVTNPIGSVTSAPITLTVVADTVPPTVVRTVNVGVTNVLVVYSKPVEAASATNTGNYVFTNGLPITGASLGADTLTVTLTTAPLVYGSNYTVVINNVRDRAGTPNTIAANTRVSFTATPYASQDIGTFSPPSTARLAGNGLDVTSGGNDIGGSADQCNFQYQVRTGDFDLAVRVAGLSPSDVWAKAALMGRETLDPAARFAAAVATPAMNGCFFESRDPAGSSAVTAGAFPPNYPYMWLRLKRAGNVFSGFASYDGQTWSQLSSATISMPSQIYVGFALSSHSSSQTTTAEFRDIINVTNAVIGVVADPREPLGPSSRKTPLVISEIMYKPAPRLDTNNVEFIELYNSNPWYQDISGYRLVASDLSYTFPPGTKLNGGAFAVVAASPQSMQNVYGLSNVFGAYTGSLKKADTLQLLDEQGAVLLTVPYANTPPWPAAADDAGHSLALVRPTYGEEDPRAWDISDAVGGSPGQMESYRPDPLRNVVINEFLAHTDPPEYDYIELYNHANQPVDISGCVLTDRPETNKFVIPPGTSIPARGFVWFSETNMNFSLSALGETIYFKNPDGSRVLDAVAFGAQENGVATGRWPDGAGEFYRLAATTPGAPNAGIRQSDIVINELMYDPISGNDDDQYVELYNRSANTVNLGGWELSDAVSFTFPSNTVMRPDSYLVVARNAARLRTNYASLNLTNCLGDYSGKLSHNGEHLALSMPDTTVTTNSQGIVTTNLIHITVNDLTYGTGGRWGQWSAGGGSSLELIDPNANNRLAANWADSDETQKSAWTNIEWTGVLDNGQNVDPSIDYAQIGLLDVGECLVDNVEVHAGAGANLVVNPDFESGTNGWTFQGDHSRSFQENSGYLSSHSLHIRCSDRMWTGDNSCQVALNSNTMGAGQAATLRFKARWLRGWPEALLRLNGNWLEATGPMPVPANLGTPGARNSRFVGDAGPAIYQVTHTPSIPVASQAVQVTARVHDPDSVTNLTLYYRIDPSTTYASVAMKDDGTGGDGVAADGVFTASIPGQAAGALVAFYIGAADSRGATTRFPALLNDGAPVRECVVRFGDANPSGSFGVYHLWVTQVNANRWSQLGDLSNEAHDCTIVNGPRVIYNCQARFAGSPYHQGFNTPDGNLCHYKWIFPDDDKFLGATSFNKLHQPGNGAGDDTSIQREQLANTFLRALGAPWLNRRYVAVYVNGSRRGTLMEDTQTPDADVVKEHFPNDSGGWLYKMQPWFEFLPFTTGGNVNNFSWCNLMPYTTAGGAKKTARYRYMFLSRRTPISANDYTNVFSLVDAASSYGTPNYVANMQNLADMENWMRVFAANHAAGNWDAYGCQNAQNLYGYIGTKGTRYSLLMFDFNIVIGNSGSWGPGANLFAVNGEDPNTLNIYNEPAFRRMYWRALQELVNGPLDLANSGPLLDAKYNAFVANGQNVENPNAAIKPWLSQAHDSIANQLAAVNAANFTVSGTVTVTADLAYITGTAPMNIKTILVNGAEYPLTWTSLTGWRVAVPLAPGSNNLSVVGVDMQGQPVPGASNNLAVIYNGTTASPIGQVVINEILYDPLRPGSEFVELYNNSGSLTFDLSGWNFHGLSYTFPPGATLGPNSFLVLAADAPTYAAIYGATTPLYGTFAGGLQTDGETLTLIQPGTNASSDMDVAKVRYGSAAPWPVVPGLGASLQLIDPRQDDWRVGNWAVAPPTPAATNSVVRSMAAFPPLWLNELQADNLTGVTNSAGQHAPWIELYNPTTNTVSLKSVYLAHSYTNLTEWAFPSNAVMNPREFKLIFTDGQTVLSRSNELHTSFALPSGSGSVALSRVATNGQVQVLDYMDYANLTRNHSYGSLPDGQAFDRQEFFYVTPGGTNNGLSAPLSVRINEWMAANTTTLLDPVTGKYSDWFELYNYGATAADLGGYYLTDNLTNQFQFQIPSGWTIPPHGFLLVWADGKSTNGTPDLHVTFKMNKDGESLGLYDSDGAAVDFVSYGPQTNDVSEGLYPDGSANVMFLPKPTPGTNNYANSAPVLAAIPDQFLNLGQTLLVTASATDTDQPPQSLTFTLGAGGPPGAAIDPVTGQLTWTPLTAPLTNLLSVVVTDNGSPSLSASRTFMVTVLPPPQFENITVNGNLLSLTWPSLPGETYEIEYCDDLDTGVWTTSGAPVAGDGTPLTFTADMTAAPTRFFRLRIQR